MGLRGLWRLITRLAILLTSYILISCTHLEKPSSFTSSDTLINRYAKGFRIIRTNDGYIAEVFNPWQQASNVTLQYHLKRNHEAKSSDLRAHSINIPVKKIVCLSSTHIAFVNALNESHTICGVSGINNVYDAAIVRRWKRDSLFEAGYENNLNYEKFIKAAPDVVFAYGIGSEINGYVDKLQQLGIPVILIGEYLEQHPLARTEWLKFFAIFFDKLDEAEQIFAHTDSLYQFWKAQANQYNDRPKVMMGLPWNGSWYVSGANTYVAQLVSDAGGKYLWDNLHNNISIPMDFETVFEQCQHADFWINIGQAMSKTDIINTDTRLALFSPFKNGNLFNNVARIRPQGGNDYWESGTVKPHLILADLVKILHPGGSFHNDSLYYYRKLY